jgi:hypothetical protein
VIPFIFVILMMAYIFGPGANLLDFGVSLAELTIEKINFEKSEIHVTVRNTGHMPISIVMADVNDRIQPAAIEPDKFLERYETALVRVPFEWNTAEPYVIGLPVRISIGIEAVEDSLRRTHEVLAKLARHEHAPLALVQRCSSVPPESPLFTALLNYRYSGPRTRRA